LKEREDSEGKIELLKVSLGEIYEPNKARVQSSILELIKTNKSKWL